MPPGAFNFGDNRFASLATSPKAKKKRILNPNNDFPELAAPSISQPNPKFIVVSAINEQKPLSQYSCFAVHRSLQVISKDIEIKSELRDGSLLLLAKDKKTAEKFIASKQLPGICDIKCKFHDNLNSVKGTVFAPYLNFLPEEEITKELAAEGVTNVYKFTKKVDDKIVPSGVILLTFDLFRLPETINISWHKVHIREYFPNPMRCRICQRLGHTIKHCRNVPICQNCSLPPHPNAECSRIKCANCEEEHASNSNKCPKFLQQKEILKIKTQRRCTIKQAREIYMSQLPKTSPPSSFAGVTASNSNVPLSGTITSKNTTVIASSNNSSSINRNSESILSKPSSNLPTISKPSIETPTTSKAIIPNIKSPKPNITYNNSSPNTSPITQLTQQLIQKHNYFVTPSPTVSDFDIAPTADSLVNILSPRNDV